MSNFLYNTDYYLIEHERIRISCDWHIREKEKKKTSAYVHMSRLYNTCQTSISNEEKKKVLWSIKIIDTYTKQRLIHNIIR